MELTLWRSGRANSRRAARREVRLPCTDGERKKMRNRTHCFCHRASPLIALPNRGYRKSGNSGRVCSGMVKVHGHRCSNWPRLYPRQGMPRLLFLHQRFTCSARYCANTFSCDHYRGNERVNRLIGMSEKGPTYLGRSASTAAPAARP